MKLIFVYGTAVLLWASAFPAIRASLGYYSPEHLAALRLLIASAALLLFALAARIPLPKRKDVPAIFLLGFCGFSVYHGALSIGEKTVEAGTASLLVSTTPLFSTLLAALFMKERLHLKNGIAALIAFLGIGIIMLGSGASFHLQLGALIILVGAFGESIYFVFQRRLLPIYGFLPLTIYAILTGTLFMLAFTPGLGQMVLAAPSSVNWTVLYLGLFPTIIPYFCLAYATAKVGVSEATSTLFLTPVVALLLAWLWLGETPALLSLAGGVLTLAGVAVAITGKQS